MLHHINTATLSTFVRFVWSCHRFCPIVMARKKLNIIFFIRVRNIVKMGSEIYKYFSWFFSYCKIFDAVFRLVFNSSPQFYSHPACRLLELQLTFCKFSSCRTAELRLCSTRTQILFKSETGQLAIWNIWTARKWVLWWKSIISHFTLHWDCSIVLVFPVKTFLGGDENFSFKFPFWPFLLYHQHCLIWNTRS